jgi:uncharacterized protein YndB with AHSA1/START domain
MRVQAEVTIRATPDEVFSFITTPENGPRWQEGAISTSLTTDRPVRMGAEMAHVGKWLGMRIPTRAVVSVYEPLRHYGYDIDSRFGSSAMRYALEPVSTGTRLTLSNEAPMPWFMRPAARFLERSIQGMFERDVVRLKSTIEADLGRSSSRPAESARS